MLPIPVLFDHAVHVVTFRVLIDKGFVIFHFSRAKVFLAKNNISSVALRAQGFVVGTWRYKYFLYNLAVKKFCKYHEPSLCTPYHSLNFDLCICRLI